VARRADTKVLSVVHVSATYVTGHARAAAERTGADGYLVSPVNAREVAQLLDNLIAARAPCQPVA
jgi:hypothetical protein